MHALPKNSVLAVAAPLMPEKQQQRISTQGVVHYTKRPQNNEKLFLTVYTNEDNPSNIELQEAEVEVLNLRAADQEFTLDKNGFELHKLEVPDIDWEDKEKVEQTVYPLVDKLLRGATGATRTHIFDHTLRLGTIEDNDGEKPSISKSTTKPNQPVHSLHVDYTSSSGIDRLSALLPDEADALRKTPFAIVQVWKPLRGPVQSSPLLMIDSSTVESDDLTPYTINFPGRTGENFAVHQNDAHRFYFADQMEKNEAYIFCCYHSKLRQDDGSFQARFTPHTGFRDKNSSPSAPPRQSVELRAYCFFEDEEPRELQRTW